MGLDNDEFRNDLATLGSDPLLPTVSARLTADRLRSRARLPKPPSGAPANSRAARANPDRFGSPTQ